MAGTKLAIRNGGTGADTAADARTNLGAEDVSNKSTSVTLGTSNTLYPSQNAVKAYVDALTGANKVFNYFNNF